MTDAISEGYQSKDGSYLWASQDGRHGMLTVTQAVREGYRQVAEHPHYAGSWLMYREAPCKQK